MSVLDDLNRASKEEFVRRLGGIYEHSPWVAERAYPARPFASIAALHDAMQAAMNSATPEEKLGLINAHPELLGRLETAQLTESSRAEQASAGLDRCTAEERDQMRALNQAYREKFGFPFIVAVRGLNWKGIIERMDGRLLNTREQELATALEQIGRITRMRLEALQ